jgi:hypothetical protein
MQPADYDQLLADIKSALASSVSSSFAIIGHTPLTYDLLGFFRSCGVEARLTGVYSNNGGAAQTPTWYKPLESLALDKPDMIILAADAHKEDLLLQAQPYLSPATTVLLSGYGHFAFRDPVFEEVAQNSLVPSLANGYPHTLTHLYQCLKNAARLDLDGVVVEFGIFKGGTTMLLSQFIEHLGRSWKVIGFDSFSGFPPKRSILDMYNHPDCVFRDEARVRQFLAGRNVEIVSGDIVNEVARLEGDKVILAFIDTDNYSSATAILDIIQDRVVVGGAIVFDHFTGRNRFRYTLGERLAAKRLLDDQRYFNLHDTGVFFRQSP